MVSRQIKMYQAIIHYKVVESVFSLNQHAYKFEDNIQLCVDCEEKNTLDFIKNKIRYTPRIDKIEPADKIVIISIIKLQ